MNAHASAKKTYRRRLWLAAIPLLALATLPILAQTGHDDDDRTSTTPPGLYITPTALPHAVQQVLNPGLANYPNFVAGEAVKAVVSPDGKTLAILTAGMNSLYNSNGNVDTATSTQFVFLYNIAGANKTHPALKQVIQQPNAHVGLVWSPNGQALYAAGGCDDAVYAYSNNGSTFVLSGKISLGHAPNGCVSNAANRTGLGLSVEPNVAGLAISADGKRLWQPITTTIQSAQSTPLREQ